MKLLCSECGRPAADGALFCASCDGLLAFEPAPDARFDPAILRLRRTSNDPRDRSGVWRFRELLPEIPFDAIVTMRENDVPLYEGPGGAAYAGVRALAEAGARAIIPVALPRGAAALNIVLACGR